MGTKATELEDANAENIRSRSPLRISTSASRPVTTVTKEEVLFPARSNSGDGTSLENSAEKLKKPGVVKSNNGVGRSSLTVASRQSSITSQSDVDPLLQASSSLVGAMGRIARPRPVIETKNIFLEYDPISKRKVLNSYEILREIGRGEHGKVKLAKDLVHNELVAIKIVNRRSKQRFTPLRMRKNSMEVRNDYESKVRREIAIMKRCNHKHIVKLKELLDDPRSNKIYLVLEYLEKGEIKWKRQLKSHLSNRLSIADDELPCRGGFRKKSIVYTHMDEGYDLLSDQFCPNLSFKQSRKVFRDVLLGLEYLHMLGIVHRDIKPANLLVNAENIVKISDFGVSFASYLDNEDASLVNEVELTKTAGTPAFFAPELCETNFSSGKNSLSASETSLEALKNESSTITKLSRPIDHRIDIWALGVTLYCLLFGKVPFNANSEYKLFQVIVNDEVEFPRDRLSFNSLTDVSDNEFELAKDLLSKILDKNPDTRIDIPQIKKHPFVLLDIVEDQAALNEFLYSNSLNIGQTHDFTSISTIKNEDPLKDTQDANLFGIGSRIKKSLLKAWESDQKDPDIRKLLLQEGSTGSATGSSSEDSSVFFRGGSNVVPNDSFVHSMILSEGAYSSQMGLSSPLAANRVNSLAEVTVPRLNMNQEGLNSRNRSSSNSFAGSKDKSQAFFWKDAFDSHSVDSSRRGSSSGIEAAQIETKRNVGGDLYLLNQSVVDAFKDIQEKDLQRRKSTASQITTPAINVTATLTSNSNFVPEDPNSISTFKGTKQVSKSRPIDIQNHAISSSHLETKLPTSAISLPLSASIESLDSIDEHYLERKFGRHQIGDMARYGTKFLTEEGINDMSPKTSDHLDIKKKFESFNLENSMSSKMEHTDGFQKSIEENNNVGFEPVSRITYSSSSRSQSCSTDGNFYSGSEDEVQVEVQVEDEDSYLSIGKGGSLSSAVCPKLSNNGGSHYNSGVSSGNGSKSSSDSDSDSDSEGEDNLTLAFSSKVARPSRPSFLSTDNRSRSHDSRIPYYEAKSERRYPVFFQENSTGLEDLPADLITTMSSAASKSTFVPVVTKSASNATLIKESTVSDSKRSANLALPEDIGYSNPGDTEVNRRRKDGQHPMKVHLNEHAESTPVLSIKLGQAGRTIPSIRKLLDNQRDSYYNYFEAKSSEQYKNHYKKVPSYQPFPNAIHGNNDKESLCKATDRSYKNLRPQIARSNSISVGVLSHSLNSNTAADGQ